MLLPVYQRRADLGEDKLVVQMLTDHASFRDAVPELRRRLEAGEPLAEHLVNLGQRLHDHARMEDRRLFSRLEETLDEAELDEIHERSKRFRRAHRGEAAIGPRN